MPACSQQSRTLRAAEAVARRRAILDRRCARRHIARAGRDGRMVPIEQKDWTDEDRATKLGQHHPLDSTKRQNILGGVRHSFYSSQKNPLENYTHWLRITSQ